ncbi:MAG: lytic transglycosylase domain-containing protein [Hyphomicrobiales bacterium]
MRRRQTYNDELTPFATRFACAQPNLTISAAIAYSLLVASTLLVQHDAAAEQGAQSSSAANQTEKSKSKGAEFGDQASVADICKALESEARKWNLPDAFFARLIWKESRFNPNAVSRKGARGIAQFMPNTALMRGLKNPFDPNSAIAASAEYLADLRDKFGNLGLAAAAYNAGQTRVRKWRAGRTRLPYETKDYVLSITGFSADDWSAKDFKQPKFSLDANSTFQAACRKLPARFSPPQETPTIAGRQIWGVQVAANFSRTRALAIYSRLKQKHRSVLAGLDPMVIRTLNRSMGTRPIFNVRLGATSRTEGAKLCARLRQSGGSCIVIKN